MPQDTDSPLYTIVDDELYEELCALEGQQVVQAAVWEDSLVDGLAAGGGRRSDGGRGRARPYPSTSISIWTAGSILSCTAWPVLRAWTASP